MWADDSVTLLDRVDRGAGSEEIGFVAPATGNYFFVVRPAPATEGAYAVTLAGTDNVLFEITYDDVVQGTLGEEGFLEYFLRLAPGETVQLGVESDSEVDPVLEILDVEEQIVADVDVGWEGEPESLRFTAPATGEAKRTFIVRVRNFAGAGDGRFTLTVSPGR